MTPSPEANDSTQHKPSAKRKYSVCPDCNNEAPLNGDFDYDGAPLVNCNCPPQSGVGFPNGTIWRKQ